MERHSSIEEVAGVPDEHEKDLLRMFDASFEHQVRSELVGIERPKTQEELQIFSLVEDTIDVAISKYKKDPIRVPEQNIHLIDPEKWPSKIAKDVGGLYSASEQLIVLESQASKTGFAARLMHELIHFKMFNAMQIVETGVNEETKEIHASIEDYRNGISGFSRDGKEKYLMSLNEAIIEEFVKRNLSTVLENPLFEDEMKKRKMMRSTAQKVVEDPEADQGSKGLSSIALSDDTFFFDLVPEGDSRTRFLQGVVPGRKSNPLIERFAYPEERKNLHLLLSIVQSRYPDQFRTTDDVFELAVSCSMDGHLLPLGRLIDGAFGKGTFRTIGQLSGDDAKTPNDLREYLLTLESFPQPSPSSVAHM